MRLRIRRSFFPSVRPLPGEHVAAGRSSDLRHWSDVRQTLEHLVPPDSSTVDAGAAWCRVVEAVPPRAQTPADDHELVA